ncbi:MAG: sulfurtransferase TusA family protein [Bacteroidetes bacterium]|nr:sulfurtransferase TusA family protein [Bacteroidota bacterium]
MEGRFSKKNNAATPSHWEYDTEFDAKELGCGDLVMALFKFFKPLDSGIRVRVKALDGGDVMAWCRSTGNTLHEGHPPFFLIEKK